MWYLYMMNDITNGTKIGLVLMQLVLFVVLYAVLCWPVDYVPPKSRRLRRLYAIVLSYIFVGFFTCALPLSMMQPETNWVGMSFLTLVWPIWLYGPMIGIDLVTLVPGSAWALMFHY